LFQAGWLAEMINGWGGCCVDGALRRRRGHRAAELR